MRAKMKPAQPRGQPPKRKGGVKTQTQQGDYAPRHNSTPSGKQPETAAAREPKATQSSGPGGEERAKTAQTGAHTSTLKAAKRQERCRWERKRRAPPQKATRQGCKDQRAVTRPAAEAAAEYAMDERRAKWSQQRTGSTQGRKRNYNNRARLSAGCEARCRPGKQQEQRPPEEFDSRE